MERPTLVWVYSLLVAAGILYELPGTIASVFSTTSDTAGRIGAMLAVVIFILQAILVYKFFHLDSTAKIWAHIAFGAAFTVQAVQLVLYFLTRGPIRVPIQAPSYFMMALTVVVWYALVDYIKGKEIDSQPVFT